MDSNGFGYDPHDAAWESSPAYRTVYRPCDDDDAAWQAAYDAEFARTNDPALATSAADAAA